MLIAGNRMPILLFLFVFVTFFFLEKKLRNFSILFTIFSILIFLIIHSFSPQIQDYTKYFFKIISEIFVFLHEIIVQGADPNITNTYIKEFYSGYVSWLENPIVGGGINSFYLNCVKNFEFCASHPHNYYLEILSEVGLIGFAVIIVVFYGILSLSVKNKNELSMNFIKNLNFPFLLLFFAEVFPIKSSGSFFTTGNATFIFLVMAILVSLSKRSKYN